MTFTRWLCFFLSDYSFRQCWRIAQIMLKKIPIMLHFMTTSTSTRTTATVVYTTNQECHHTFTTYCPDYSRIMLHAFTDRLSRKLCRHNRHIGSCCNQNHLAMVYKSAITPPIRDVAVYNPSGRCYNIYKILIRKHFSTRENTALYTECCSRGTLWIPVLDMIIWTCSCLILYPEQIRKISCLRIGLNNYERKRTEYNFITICMTTSTSTRTTALL